jgi:peptide chain release factor subunit 3
MNCPNIICSGFIAILHLHSVVITVEIVKLIRMIDKKTGKVIPKITPIFIKNGQMCIVRLKTTEPICIETFKDNSHMGRFTLRNNDESIAFGKVLKVVS